VLSLIRGHVVNDFSRRAQLYACLDRSLAQHTRFFGAAALTNSMLAVLFSRHANCLPVSATTSQFLQHLGGYLEDFNLGRVKRIKNSETRGARLDVAMVQSEQAQVECQLNRLERSDATTYDVALTELDRILNSPGWLTTCGNLVAGATTYRLALRTVRTALGRPIRFGDRFHRESIGWSLIGLLRGAATRTP
jgi:hypothetical protein